MPTLPAIARRWPRIAALVLATTMAGAVPAAAAPSAGLVLNQPDRHGQTVDLRRAGPLALNRAVDALGAKVDACATSRRTVEQALGGPDQSSPLAIGWQGLHAQCFAEARMQLTALTEVLDQRGQTLLRAAPSERVIAMADTVNHLKLALARNRKVLSEETTAFHKSVYGGR